MNAQLGFCIALVSLAACAGCGGEDVTLTDLTGSVTYDGKPVAYGQIRFTPDNSKNHTGPQGYAVIENGKYDTAVTGKGVVPGPHIVSITAFDQKPPTVQDDVAPDAKTATRPIFTDYKVAKDIEPPSQDFAVPANAKGYNPQKPASRPGNEP